MIVHAPQKTKVLFLVNGFNIGGAEKGLLELVRRLDRRKYHIVVCSVGHGGPLQKEFEATAERVVVFEKKYSFDFSLIRKVASLMKQEKIDLLQTTLFYADVIGTFAARLARVPAHISWAVNAHPDGTNVSKLRHRLAYRTADRYINKFVPVSESVRNYLIERRHIPAGKIHLIYYGVDTDEFAAPPDQQKKLDMGLKKQDCVLGVVARLTPQKGHYYLINAAGSIINKFPDVKFLFAGDGIMRTSLENQVHELGLDDYFQFPGFRNDIRDLIRTFDLFILPSLYEGLPNAVLEAMASGKPVVASAVNGIKEAIIHGVNGLLVPPGDSEALAHAIIRLLEDRKLAAQLGSAARKHVVEHFSLDREVKAFESLYDSSKHI